MTDSKDEVLMCPYVEGLVCPGTEPNVRFEIAPNMVDGARAANMLTIDWAQLGSTLLDSPDPKASTWTTSVHVCLEALNKDRSGLLDYIKRLKT